MSSFWKVVHQRVIKETVDSLKLTREQIVIRILGYAIFVLVCWLFLSWTQKDLWEALRNPILWAFGIPIVSLRQQAEHAYTWPADSGSGSLTKADERIAA